MITLIKLQSLFGKLASKGMRQVFDDWEMLVGFKAKATCEPIQIVASADDAAAGLGPKHVLVETQVLRGDEAIGPIHFAFPDSLVIEIIGDLLMIPEAAREEKMKSGLTEGDIEAFQEMANLLCGSWNRIFQELDCDLKISQSVDDLRVLSSDGEIGALVEHASAGRKALLSYEVSAADGAFPLAQVIPFDVTIAIAEEFLGEKDPRSAART